MKYLFMWLAGPLQSWGADSRFDFRQTLDFPTKSGLYGLLLASSGDAGPQEELLARMADAPLTVVTFAAAGERLRDFHMVGNGYDEKDKWESLHIPRTVKGNIAVGGGAKRTYRNYLQDRVFAVFLGLPDDLAEKFAASLRQPRFDLYLGRKCCVPSAPVFQGLYGTGKEAVAALERFLVAEAETRNAEAETRNVEPRNPEWIIRTADDGRDPEAFLLNDVPVRFGLHRLYRDRWVTKTAFTSFADLLV